MPDSGPAVVELMCSVGLTPGLIIQAFSSGAKGVLVLHRDPWNEHYLGIDYDVDDVVSSTREIMMVAGMDPEKLMSSLFSREFTGRIVEDFRARLDSRGLEAYGLLSDEEQAGLPTGRIGRQLLQLELLAEQKGRQVSPLLLEGKVLKAAGLPNVLEMLSAIDILAAKLCIDFGKCSDRADQGEEVVVATPEGYRMIMEYLGEGGKASVTVLPSRIAEGLSQLSFKAARPQKVGFLGGPAATAGDSPFFTALNTILEAIPGCELVNLGPMDCGATGWRKPDARTREKAMAVYRKAEEAGVSLILTPSADCLTHLKACNRPGAWRHSSVELVDPYSFILSRLEGGGSGE